MATGYEIEKLIVSLVGEADQYHKMLEAAVAATEKFPNHITAIMARAASAIGPSLREVETKSVLAFSEFDLAATQSTSIMKVTQDEIKAIRDASLQLAQESARSPAELAKAFYYLASAGMNAEQSVKALPAVTKFATAGAFDLARATDLSVGALNALGMKVADPVQNLENLTRVMDVVARVSKISHGTTEQYATALSRDAAPTMRQYNISLEEGAAILAAYGANNIKAELAGNTFGRMIRLLASAATHNADAHKRMGFAVFDASGRMRPLADIVENLEQVLGKLSPEARSSALEMMGFKVLSQKALLPLVGMSKKIREFHSELKNAGGSVDTIANNQLGAFANQMKILSNTIEVAYIKIGENLAPALRLIGEGIGYTVSLFNSAPPIVQRAVAVFISLVGAIAPLILVLGALAPLWANGIGVVLPILLAVGGAVKGVLVAAFAALYAAVAGLPAALSSLLALDAARGAGPLAALFFTAAAAAVALVAAYALLSKAYGELNAATQKGAELQKQILSRQEAQTAAILKQANAIQDPTLKRNYLAEQMQQAEKELSGYQFSVKNAQKNVEDLNGVWNRWTGNKVLKAAQGELSEAEAGLKLAKDRVSKLKMELGEGGPGVAAGIPPKVLDDIGELTKKLLIQEKTLNMTSTEADLYKLKLAGATDASLANARGLAQLVAEAEKLKKLREDVKSTTASYQEQLSTFGLTGREAEIMKLQLRGASDEQLRAARSASAALDMLEEQGKLMQKGEEITRKYMTPQEKLAETQQELEDLYSLGAISWEVYTKAMADAAGQARKTGDAVRGIEGAAFGSAEALSRVDAFREAFSPAMNGERAADPTIDYLRRIAKAVERSAEEPTFEVEEGAFSDVGF